MAKISRQKRLPIAQLAILSICRFAEPIALTSVFPYLPEMIESFGVAKTDVPAWAGTTSAIFSVGQALTGIAWGRASDRFGRKYSLLAGLSMTMLFTLLFGFSTSLPSAIIARAIIGASSGTVGITRTAVAEMVPEKELQPRAFSIMPLVWSIGSIIGPTLGGVLANPAKMYPQLFGHNMLLKIYPYCLPNIMSSALLFVGLILGTLFLKETLETQKDKRDYGRILGQFLYRPFRKHAKHADYLGDEERSLLRSKSSGERKQKLAVPSYREVLTRQSILNLVAYSLLALHSIAYDQLIPVFLHLPPQEDRLTNPDVSLPFKFGGGFGLDSGRIGFLFTMNAVFAMLVQFTIFPPVAQRYGVLNCFKVCTLGFPIAYLLTPFTVLFPTPQSQQAALFAVMVIKCFAAVFAFPCTTILLTNSASSLRILGTLNGISVSLSSVGRALGPALAGAAFTWGIDVGYVITPWWLLSIFGVLGHISTYFLVESDGPGQAAGLDSDHLKAGTPETQSLLSLEPHDGVRNKYSSFNDGPLDGELSEDGE